MDFDEFFKKRHIKTGLYEKSLCGDDDSLYIRHEIRKSFKAGQQSKQAQINRALELLRKPIQGAVADLLSDLEDILDDT